MNRKILAIIKNDLRTNFRDKIKCLSLAVAIILPLAYGFLYLWAFWNPYSNMKNVAVAVVNQDKGTTFKNQEENFGNRIIDELKNDDTLNWDFVDYDKATAGLDNQKYYAIILIPEDFSKNIVSADTDAPEQAKLEWQTRDSTNFLFTTYFKNVIAAVEDKINKNIMPEFSKEADSQLTLLTGQLDQASSGAQELSTGLGQLHDGSKTLNENLNKASSGAQKLSGGLSELDSKSKDLQNGVGSAKEGSATLASGIKSADSGMTDLNEGIGKLESGSTELKNGSAKAVSGSRTLANGANEMNSKLEGTDEALSPFYPFVDEMSSWIDDKNAQSLLNIPNYIPAAKEQKEELLSGSQQIADGSETLAKKMVDLNEGVGTLKDGISSAKSGADTLESGMHQLSTGASSLNNGLINIYDGTQKYTGGVNDAYYGSQELSNGLSQIAGGSSKLTDGIGSAKSGADTLGQKLSEGSGELKEKLNAEKVDKLITIINKPIVIQNDSQNANETYGAGFAPYFIPLALWMGALILTLLIPVRDPRINLQGVSKIEMTLGKFFLLSAVGICQAGLLSLSVIYGLGLHARYPLELVLFCILISLTFISVMQFLSFTLGKVGELLGIIFLMVQLTSASGTFPVESAPRFFQVCSPLVPMTYTIRGLRLFILGGQMRIAFQQALILGGFLLLFLAMKTIATKRTVSATDIYPLIEL